jgi:hypothetical protein
MASGLNKQYTLHSLHRALTEPLTSEECETLIKDIGGPHVQFLAAAACTWNRKADTPQTLRTTWKTAYAPHAAVRQEVYVALFNHTSFPHCRTGLSMAGAVHANRLSDYAFVETNGMSVVECFVRGARPECTPEQEKLWQVRLLMAGGTRAR